MSRLRWSGGWSRSRVFAVMLVVLMIVGACGSPTPSSAIDVDLAEFSISPSNTVLAAGDVALNIRNVGEFGHTVVVSRSDGRVIAGTDVVQSGEGAELSWSTSSQGITSSPAGSSWSADGHLVDHYEMGMSRSVTVTG